MILASPSTERRVSSDTILAGINETSYDGPG